MLLLTFTLAAQTNIVPFGSSWKYLDKGTDQGTAWRAAAFNDATWGEGPGKFGYGISDASTKIEFGPNAKKKYITTYFRKSIDLGASAYASYTANVKRDDGVVVYVNGAEVYRNNMPTGTITYTTLAVEAKDNGTVAQSFTIPSSAFASGPNVIAVEIHQQRANTPDMAFDLELVGNTTPPPPPVEQYTLAVSTVGSGTVSKSPNQSTYAPGSSVQLTATPASGYQFAGWSGDASGTVNPLTVTMDGNKAITATFTAVQAQYSLSVSTSGSGTVTKDPNQATYTAGSTVRLTATPALGYQFSGWSGDASGNTNPLTVTMDGNKAITATFTAVQDKTPPTVLSINRQNPTAETTSATSVTFRATFSEQVTGVDAGDFTATAVSGTVQGTVATAVAVSSAGTAYDVAVGSITGTGTLRLDLKASGTGIADVAGNPLSGGYTGGQAYTIEQESPPPPSSSTIISYQSAWKYLDNGTDQGTAWRASNFNDGSWGTGYGKFGYGISDATTVVSYGPVKNNKYITTYFRKAISISSDSDYGYYAANVKRDDGVVVYVNGVEVYRNNMPLISITYTTLAAASSDNGATPIAFNIPGSAFAKGTNVVAVEIHQNNATSSDMAFDLEIVGKTGSPPVEQPKVLYYEGFESGSGFAGMHLQSSTTYGFKVVDSPTFRGTKVGRFELRKGDVEASGGTRTEVLFTEALAQETTWHSFAAYFPSVDYQDDTLSYEINNQWHQGSSWGSPMLQLRILKGRFYFNRRSTTAPSVQYDLGPQPKDQWTNVVIHLKQHTNDGFMKIWINGRLVLNITGETMFPDTDPVPYGRWKMGIYKPDWNNGGTYKPSSTTVRVWYVDEVKIGNAASNYELMEPVGNNVSVLSAQATSTQSLLNDQEIMGNQANGLQVYPTLAKRGSTLTVKTNSHEQVEAIITDVTGRLIYTSKFIGTTSIETAVLPSGLYFICPLGKKQAKKQKFVVTD